VIRIKIKKHFSFLYTVDLESVYNMYNKHAYMVAIIISKPYLDVLLEEIL